MRSPAFTFPLALLAFCHSEPPPPTSILVGLGLVAGGGTVKVYEGSTSCEPADTVKTGDLLKMHYTGSITGRHTERGIAGEQFDSSRTRGETFDFRIGSGKVIQGWEQGLLGLCVGAKAILVIPPDMGYGQREKTKIPGGSTLHFDVEVVSVTAYVEPQSCAASASEAGISPPEDYAAPVPDVDRLHEYIKANFGEKDGTGSPTWMPSSTTLAVAVNAVDKLPGTNWIGLGSLEIGDTAFAALASLLPLAPLTTKLALNGNNLTDASVPWLATVIPLLLELRELNIRDNPGITDVSIDLVKEAILAVGSLRKIQTAGTGMSEQAAKHFEAARLHGHAKYNDRKVTESVSWPYDGYDKHGRALDYDYVVETRQEKYRKMM